jgi:hypothetical protein
VYLPRVVKTQREEASRFRNLESLLDGGKLPAVPEPGEMAPDFELRTDDGQSTVRLSSLCGRKPVVLIFGCFTCGNYRTYSESLEEIHRRWKDKVEFLRVYVREAHPVGDRAATGTNALAGILYKQPVTFEERCAVAGDFVQAMKIETPLVVDEIDNRVGRDYGAWPDRLYIVDRDGRIAYQGARGPFGFNPREMEQSLLLMLAEESVDDSPNN